MISLERAIELKNSLYKYIKTPKVKKELLKEASHYKVKEREINLFFKDWFIFDRLFNTDNKLINNFFEREYTDLEKFLVGSWKNYIFSIFKISKVDKKHCILNNLINSKKYKVETNSTNKEITKGEFILARIIPFNDDYIFSELNENIELEKNQKIYNIIAKFELEFPHTIFIDNDKKLQTSYLIQELEYKDFVDFFGIDEIIVRGNEVESKLKEFYDYRYFQKRQEEEGLTIAKMFRKKYGSYPDLPGTSSKKSNENNFETFLIPEKITELDQIGIIYDPIEGLMFLPWYGLFKDIFSRSDFKKIPGYKKCVMAYLTTDSISIKPFKKVFQENPLNATHVICDVLKRKRFSLPNDFLKLMNKYKPQYVEKYSKPNIIPMPEITKALLRSKAPKEYVPINILENRSHYKDIYKIFKFKNDEG